MTKNENFNGEEFKKEKQEQMKQILESLEDGVKSVFTSENYVEFLRTFSKFHHYSYANSVLIMMQCPTATQVASYMTWKKEFHRQVKKGEKGIRILVPTPKKIKVTETITNPDGSESVEETDDEKKVMYFKFGNVFDVSQTEGEPLPRLAKNLEADDEYLDDLLSVLIDTSEVKIDYDDTLGEDGANGYYRILEQSIAIKPTMSTLQKLKTLFHEYSHFLQETTFAAKVKEYGSDTKEVIAESCAFCVFEMLANETGLEIFDSSEYSFGYIAGWGSKDLKELKATLSLIAQISNLIYDWVSPNLAAA